MADPTAPAGTMQQPGDAAAQDAATAARNAAAAANDAAALNAAAALNVAAAANDAPHLAAAHRAAAALNLGAATAPNGAAAFVNAAATASGLGQTTGFMGSQPGAQYDPIQAQILAGWAQQLASYQQAMQNPAPPPAPQQNLLSQLGAVQNSPGTSTATDATASAESGFFTFVAKLDTELEWKSRVSVDRNRYKALYEIHQALDALQKKFLDPDSSPPEMIELYNSAAKGLYKEMEFIKVAETFSWNLVAHAERAKQDNFALDPDMQKRLEDANKEMKEEIAKQRTGKWPFRRGGGQSGPRFNQNQWGGGGYHQSSPGPMADYGMRFPASPYGVPYGAPPQPNVIPGAGFGQYFPSPAFQQRRPIGPCHTCHQFGHLRAKCPNGAAPKDKP